MGLRLHTRTVRVELRFNTEITFGLLPIIFMVLVTEFSAEKTSTSYVSRCWCSQA